MSYNKKILTWNYLQQFDNNPPQLKLPRNINTQNKYEIFINQLDIKQKTVSDYIISKYFDNNTLEYNITPNDFPYNTTDDIKHLLIWFNPNNKLNENLPDTFNDGLHKGYIKFLLNEIDEYNNKDFIMWENLPNNKSVNDIRHIHIFIKIL